MLLMSVSVALLPTGIVPGAVLDPGGWEAVCKGWSDKKHFAESMARRYMAAGGRLVWMGDVATRVERATHRARQSTTDAVFDAASLGVHIAAEHEVAAWQEKPRRLGDQLRLVGHVAPGVLAPDDVERAGAERHIEGVAELERDLAIEAGLDAINISVDASGKDVFEEVVDLGAIAGLADPLREQLQELARSHGEQVP